MLLSCKRNSKRETDDNLESQDHNMFEHPTLTKFAILPFLFSFILRLLISLKSTGDGPPPLPFDLFILNHSNLKKIST